MSERLNQEIRDFVVVFLEKKAKQQGKVIQGFDDDFQFLTSGLLDSFGFMELLTAVEANWNITVDLSEVEPTEFGQLDGFVRTVFERQK